jgi:hypothetical protein
VPWGGQEGYRQKETRILSIVLLQLAFLDKMASCPTGSPGFVIAQEVEYLAVERAKVGIGYAAGGYGGAAVAGYKNTPFRTGFGSHRGVYEPLSKFDKPG